MDPILVSMVTQYMTKTGSIAAESRDLFARMSKYIDGQDTAKTASISANRDEAKRLAHRMSETRLSGIPLIEGYAQVKDASGMLSSHEGALKAFDLILNVLQQAPQKSASLEPGRVDHQAGGGRPLTAKEELLAECGITPSA